MVGSLPLRWKSLAFVDQTCDLDGKPSHQPQMLIPLEDPPVIKRSTGKSRYMGVAKSSKSMVDWPAKHIPWRIHGAGIWLLTWLGYIDGIHVTIAAPWILYGYLISIRKRPEQQWNSEQFLDQNKDQKAAKETFSPMVPKTSWQLSTP